MAGNRNKLIAFNYFGGKFQIVEKLYKYFPEHVHFVDVFCGSMVITLNKEPSKIDTANDISGKLINFFKVLREHPNELITSLALTPVSREEYNLSWKQSKDPIENARRFYIRVRQSYFGLGGQRENKGWHLTKTHANARYGETVSKWLNSIDKLPFIIDRLKQIQIENRNYDHLIKSMDFDGAFFYCDPPYPAESRVSGNDYEHEFSVKEHKKLSKILHNVKGKVMISGYDCLTMQKLYGDWNFVNLHQNNQLRRIGVEECIWMNYKPKLEQIEFEFKELK